MPAPTDSRCVLEVNASAVRHNLDVLSARNDHAKILAVCKADFYGCGDGLYPFIGEKIDALGVATVEEGIRMRTFCGKPILVFGYVPPSGYLSAFSNELSFSIGSKNAFLSLQTFARQLNVRLKVHVKVDTGMHRFGFSYTDVSSILSVLSERAFRIEGIYTHFATENDAFYRLQRERFSGLVEYLLSKGYVFPFIHASNTGAARLGSPVGNTVRVGYGMYGFTRNLIPAVRVLGRIVQVRTLENGEGVGYGLTYVSTESRRIATVSVGYADGYPRDRSNNGFVLYKGDFLPIVGRVCMDCLFVDVTGKTVCEGDYVTLLGKEGEKILSPDDLGFGYEALCRFHSLRGERRYLLS